MTANPFPAGTECAARFDDWQDKVAAGHWTTKTYPGAGTPAEIVRSVEDGLRALADFHRRNSETNHALFWEAVTILRDLVATIELHTDCMANTIDRESLEPYLERAERFMPATKPEALQ